MYYVMESVFYSIPERDLTSYFDEVTEYLFRAKAESRKNSSKTEDNFGRNIQTFAFEKIRRMNRKFSMYLLVHQNLLNSTTFNTTTKMPNNLV